MAEANEAQQQIDEDREALATLIAERDAIQAAMEEAAQRGDGDEVKRRLKQLRPYRHRIEMMTLDLVNREDCLRAYVARSGS